ncbi:hypothetical protein [Bradyrhizobium sp. USDA 4504]
MAHHLLVHGRRPLVTCSREHLEELKTLVAEPGDLRKYMKVGAQLPKMGNGTPRPVETVEP